MPVWKLPDRDHLTATRATVTARSPLPHGFTGQGAAFSPHGTRLAVFERTASIDSPCCASNSVLATVNTRTGAVRAVRAARLVTDEDAGWILWLPGCLAPGFTDARADRRGGRRPMVSVKAAAP
jgi:hypothetical protein